ncbi:16S rRNA processing protein RimM [candidate division KSB1 bacterium]|nr:16S rRNA processing protein RimM [candidate division KSB1 bacterium]
MVEIGKITRAHGIRGEVKVILYSNNPEWFQSLHSLFVSSQTHQGEWKKILKRNLVAKRTIIHFEGLETRNEAEDFCGCMLSIKQSDLPELPEDLIGFDVKTSENSKIGVLKEILEMPTQDVYVIETEKGEVMIPAVEAFIKKIDSSKREILIKPIDGMLELDAD